MLDRFDVALLNLIQRDDSQTADRLAEKVALSPSAIARRLRRLRRDGWVERTIALLGPKATSRRLKAVVFVQLSEHADHAGKAALQERLIADPRVQFCYDMTGAYDILVMFDCAHMAEFNEATDRVLTADATVRRYETSFVKREVKFAPFVELS
jgi:Lrp/AsnC family leucine-responsive transcriptional regulator